MEEKRLKALDRYRYFLKDDIRKKIDFRTTDQHRGVAAPPFQKPAEPGAERFDLPEISDWRSRIGTIDLVEAIAHRESRRHFTSAPLPLEELAFLLWATQGVKEVHPGTATLRTVPSAGARHAFETYLTVFRVDGLDPGLYRYLPLDNQLVSLGPPIDLREKLIKAALLQTFVGRGAVTFLWTATPYRMEWRYSLAAHRVILLDAGHLCQNLYLACEAIGAGTCAVGAYDQDLVDRLLEVDGEDEFCIYLAPVGKVAETGG